MAAKSSLIACRACTAYQPRCQLGVAQSQPSPARWQGSQHSAEASFTQNYYINFCINAPPLYPFSLAYQPSQMSITCQHSAPQHRMAQHIATQHKEMTSEQKATIYMQTTQLKDPPLTSLISSCGCLGAGQHSKMQEVHSYHINVPHSKPRALSVPAFRIPCTCLPIHLVPRPN